LFDTFEGMPETDPTLDFHRRGDFEDTSLASVMGFVGDHKYISYHKGTIPETFVGLEDSMITFAHIDVDIFKSVKDCCEFIYPKMRIAGGVIVFDDYGFPSCPGALLAVDQFFVDKKHIPLVLQTGQAVVFL